MLAVSRFAECQFRIRSARACRIEVWDHDDDGANDLVGLVRTPRTHACMPSHTLPCMLAHTPAHLPTRPPARVHKRRRRWRRRKRACASAHVFADMHTHRRQVIIDLVSMPFDLPVQLGLEVTRTCIDTGSSRHIDTGLSRHIDTGSSRRSQAAARTYSRVQVQTCAHA